MRTRNRIRLSAALASTLLVPTISAGIHLTGCTDTEEQRVCSSTTNAPTIQITQGAGFCNDDAPPCQPGTTRVGGDHEMIVGPYVISGTAAADDFITNLTVGGEMASAPDSDFATWTVTLTQADLEAARVPGTQYAKIDVTASDYCTGAGTTPLAYTYLQIGPDSDAGLTVALAPDTSLPAGRCYLPESGAGIATLTISTTADYNGAMVALAASAGTITPATVSLVEASSSGSGTSATAFFVSPSTLPTGMLGEMVTLIADSEGSVSNPASVLVAAPPAFPVSTLSLDAGASAVLQVSTMGTLKECHAAVAQPDPTATHVCAQLVGQTALCLTTDTQTVASNDTCANAGPCNDSAALTAYAKCAYTKSTSIEVTMDATTPAGTSITLSCTDMLGQVGSATVTVVTDGG